MADNKRQSVSVWCRFAPMYHVVTIVFWLSTLCANIFKRRPSSRTESKMRTIRGPCIIVSNHPQDSDPLVLGVRLVPLIGLGVIHWIAKRELVDPLWLRQKYIPWCPRFIAHPLAWCAAKIVRGYGVLPVDRVNFVSAENLQALKAAEELINRGGIIGIFPEGGTNPMLKFGDRKISPIAARLASKFQVPIVPVSIAPCGSVVVGDKVHVPEGIKPVAAHLLSRSIMVAILRTATEEKGATAAA